MMQFPKTISPAIFIGIQKIYIQSNINSGEGHDQLSLLSSMFLLLLVRFYSKQICEELQGVIQLESRSFLAMQLLFDFEAMQVFFLLCLVAREEKHVIIPYLDIPYLSEIIQIDLFLPDLQTRVDVEDVAGGVDNQDLVVCELEEKLMLRQSSFYLFLEDQVKHRLSLFPFFLHLPVCGNEARRSLSLSDIPDLQFRVTSRGHQVGMVERQTLHRAGVPKHFALHLVLLPVPKGYETAVASQGQSHIIDFFQGQQRVASFVFDHFFIELIMLVDVPDPGTGVMTCTCYILPIFEEDDLRYLFFVAFVPVHQFQTGTVPDTDQLLLFVGNYDQKLFNSHDEES